MTAPAPMDRDMVLRALGLMADHLAAAAARGELLIAGGAVIALTYDTTRVTRDVDGLVTEGHGPVMDAAGHVGAELRLPRGWLNEGISIYLSTQPDPDQALVFDHPNLAVTSVSGEHLFALKARAARAQDLDDLRLLCGTLGITTSTEAFRMVDRFFPEDPLSDRASRIIEDLLDST